MSQKTNPLSLRLQKSNQNFLSPWFSDFFFDENYHYQFEIEEYITRLLKEAEYSKAFFVAKISYRKSNISLIIQDVRAQKKENQLSFNLKQNLLVSKPSTLSFFEKINKNKAKKHILFKVQELINSGYENSLPKVFLNEKIEKNVEKLRKDAKIKRLYADRGNRVNPLVENSANSLTSLISLKAISLNEKKKVSKTSFVNFRENPFKNRTLDEDKILQKKKLKDIKTAFIFSFRKKVRDTFLKYKQNYNLDDTFCFEEYLDFFDGKDSFYNSEKKFKHLWETNWKNQITKNNCFSFCEKIVSDNNFKSLDESITSKVKIVLPFSTTRDCHEVAQSSGKPFCDTTESEPCSDTIEGELAFQEKYPKARNKFTFPTFLPLLEYQKRSIKTELTSSNLVSLFPVTTYFEPIRFISGTQNVIALLDTVIVLLEKRVSFRQIKSRLFQNLAKNSQIKGIRISCSGRLGGRSKKAQKAKMQSDQWGETSLNAFSSKVLFASKSAYTAYGKVGIKIWLSFKEDVF